MAPLSLTGVPPPALAPAVVSELLLPPHAARPMAAKTTTAIVNSPAFLRFIFDPLLCDIPNLASSTWASPRKI
jgi:hypothetical protein